jgi:hypothetical protein
MQSKFIKKLSVWYDNRSDSNLPTAGALLIARTVRQKLKLVELSGVVTLVFGITRR